MTGEDSGMAMSQVFISYHRAQRKLARLIAHRVAADGHAVWWDRGERPGDAWSEAVSTALANSACVIVIWSKLAATSPWVLGEATAGFGRGALVSVMADKTTPPSPFGNAPMVDMHDWAGDSVDLAWVRLREPLRAKMQAAEKVADAQAPLVPQRASPVRVGFSSAAMAPPAPAYEEKRGSGFSTLLVLALGGLGATGWYYRDQVRDELARLQAAQSPAPVEQTLSPATPPIASASMPMPAPADAPLQAESQPAAPATVPSPPPARPPVPAMTETYENWRDTFVPAPVLRTVPSPSGGTPPASDVVSAVNAAPATTATGGRLDEVRLRQGKFVDLDPPGGRRRTDVWFGPDQTGRGLYLGVDSSARIRATSAARATPALCAAGALRRTPIPVHDLIRSGGLCLRSTEGVVSAWRVEGMERGETGGVLRLRAVTP